MTTSNAGRFRDYNTDLRAAGKVPERGNAEGGAVPCLQPDTFVERPTTPEHLQRYRKSTKEAVVCGFFG